MSGTALFDSNWCNWLFDHWALKQGFIQYTGSEYPDKLEDSDIWIYPVVLSNGGWTYALSWL